MHFLLFYFLTGDLEAFKKQAFVLKEGVEYKIKISFKVRAAVATDIYRNMVIACFPGIGANNICPFFICCSCENVIVPIH